MVTCRQVLETLIDYICEDMPQADRQLFDQHLRACPPCVTYIETYQKTIKLTRQLPPQPVPPELLRRLRTTIERHCPLRNPETGQAGYAP